MLGRARKLLKSSLSSIKLTLAPPTASEMILLQELRGGCRFLSEREITQVSAAEDTWSKVANHFRYLVATEDPRRFLEWEHLRTMVFEDSQCIEPELQHLKQSPDWTAKWSPAIIESKIGRPKPFSTHPQSSGNLIHHAYHLCRFEEITGTPASDFDLVFEFGGGYGSLCRAFHNLGFRGRYIIFDLAEFGLLQRYFLKSLGLPHENADSFAEKERGICTLSDLVELRRLLPIIMGNAGRALFVATWSLSEAPIQFRASILDLVSDFDAWLLAYQSQFGEVRNEDYFAEVASRRPEFFWHHFPIEHIPEQFYLFGERIGTQPQREDQSVFASELTRDIK